MASFQTFPPHRLHSSELIPQSQASQLVSSYLEAAAADASLHPNALLTESGPVSSNQGSQLGLVLHNLQRVEAGLRGEYLEADFDLKSSEDSTTGFHDASWRNDRYIVDESSLGVDWQDKDDFEKEQGDEQSQIRPQSTTILGHTSITSNEQPSGSMTVVDKEARKRRKKERRQKEKSLKAKKRNEVGNEDNET